MHKLMAQAAVICESSIMRSAIATSLEKNGIRCASDRDGAPVAIVVSGLISCPKPGEDFCKMEGVARIGAKQWIVLTGEKDDPICRNLVESGHEPCIVSKEIDGNDLSHVVRLVSSGHVLSIGGSSTRCTGEDARRLKQADLTDGDWDILVCLAEGPSNKEIALQFNTTEGAIKARLRSLLRRLDLNNRTKAAVLAARSGFHRSDQNA